MQIDASGELLLCNGLLSGISILKTLSPFFVFRQISTRGFCI
jgi:hypothetical protein